MARSSSALYPSLEGRHALITGGADGIGAELVEAFCRQRAVITFLDIDEMRARATIARVVAAGLPPPHFHPCDVTDIGQLQTSIATAIDERGPVRVLVNNAANDERHDWRTVTPQDWDWRTGVNLKHHFFAIQTVAPAMAAAGGGSIVNMSSISWQLGLGGMPCYVAAKSGVIGLTRSFARDLGGDDIRVNAVLPGWIMTRRQTELHLTPKAEAELIESQCLKWTLTPQDLAPMVMFLASDDSRACTNQSYIVDGGWT